MKTKKPTKILFCLAFLAFAHASQAATFYVATNGNDQNPGSLASPFRTIQKAADRAKPGDTCLIRAGRYHETVQIRSLKPIQENPIVFAAYEDEIVTLDGSEPIQTTWTRHKGDIYKTRIPKPIWQLFADGKSMSSARWPNGNWNDGSIWDNQKSMAWPEKKGSEFGHHTNAALKELDFSLEDGGIIIVASGSFKTYKSLVTRHEAGSDNFTYDLKGVRAQGMGFRVDQHRYFLEGKLGLLDAEGEWFYEPRDSTLYFRPPAGQNPKQLDIRGKTLSYFFDVMDSSYITLKGLHFFGATFQFINSDHITVEDCELLYPSYSKRMLRDLRPMDVTKMLVAKEFTPAHNTIRNCVIEYADGPALQMNGLGNLIENCYMHDIDYSCTYAGGFTLNMIDAPELTFRRNTIHTTGSSELFKAGVRNLIELNDLSRSGFLQSDGSMIQVSVKQQPGNVTRYNWLHDSVKQGFRFDNSNKPNSPWGEGGRADHNVAWKVDRQFIKGDKHFIHNNLAFDCALNDLSISSDISIQGRNHGTITRNNIAAMLSGSRTKPASQFPVPGHASHNWSGLEAKRDVRTVLRDPDNLDFRPRANSEIIDAGSTEVGIEIAYLGKAPDIGPYEFGDRHYWIPGRQAPEASRPIPPDGNRGVKTDADLMWLQGYRAQSHDLYFGASKEEIARATKSSKSYQKTFTGPNNIFTPPAPLKPGATYYWRVDAIREGKTVKGKVWSFTIGP